jgi:hypothetical protein
MIRPSFERATAFERLEVLRWDKTATVLELPLNPALDRARSIRDDLKELTSKMDNIAGLPKEIDHALERIRTIEKHLGIHTDICVIRLCQALTPTNRPPRHQSR